MENHGINMKGKYFMQSASSPTAGGASDQRRIVFNTGTSLNGASDATFGQNKMVFHNGSQWCRPLLANVSDGPHANNTIDLGGSSNRFYRIYVGNSGSGGIYGQVRYS